MYGTGVNRFIRAVSRGIHSHSPLFSLFHRHLNSEEQAATAYDIIAIKCRGERAQTNFDLRNYAGELANLDSITEEDLVLSLRRQSKGFSKGSSRFRGVTRHAKGKFEARIGQIVGKKYRCACYHHVLKLY